MKRDRLNEPLVVELSEQVVETKRQHPEMTCDEIGVKFGVSGTTIRYCLLRHGYTLERPVVPRCPACGTFMSKTAEGWVCKTCPKRLQQAHERASLVITSWFGEKGRLAYDPVEDKVQCHICGKWYKKLEAHVWPKHGLLADEYREEFGLNRNTPLASVGFREMKREEAIRLIKEGKIPWPLPGGPTLEELIGMPERIQPLRLEARLDRREYELAHPERVAHMRETKPDYNSPPYRAMSSRKASKIWEKRRAGELPLPKTTARLGGWLCSCGQLFKTKRLYYEHSSQCEIAKEAARKKQSDMQKRIWGSLSHEDKQGRSASMQAGWIPRRLKIAIDHMTRAENHIVRLMNDTEGIEDQQVLDEARKGIQALVAYLNGKTVF